MNVYEISRNDTLTVNYCVGKWYTIYMFYFYIQQSDGEFNIIIKDKIYSMRISFRDYKIFAKFCK